MNRAPTSSGGLGSRLFLGLVAGLSLFLVVHNYCGFDLLPTAEEEIPADQIHPDAAEFPKTYVFAFDRSEPDGPHAARSRTRIFQDGAMLAGAPTLAEVVRLVGQGNWAHEPGRIIFSTPDGSDPRVNGKQYLVSYPLLYSHAIGRTAAAVFLLAVAGLHWLGRTRAPTLAAPATSAPTRWRWHLAGAGLLFLAGLYCSTGTLAPYANTTIPHVAKASSYLYNPDHPHFQALFNFLDRRDPATWNSLFVRRILYNVLAYPFMKAAGWEVGGTLASICFNVAAFFIFLFGVRRRIGERGTIFAAWLLALYPGAGYWAGMPYFHALIVPGSLLLMLALVAIAEDPGWRPVLLGSLLMGVANLGYEFFVFFLPATLLLLAWRRRWAAIPVAAALQAAPLLLWTLLLKYHFRFDLTNSNTSAFSVILGSYFDPSDFARWRAILGTVPDVGLDLFFGANFIFLPLLLLVVVALNAVTSRIRPHPAEVALLLAGLALFLFNNLAPEYVNFWQMRGTWIARIYQPVFAAFVWFCARWRQALPPLARPAHAAMCGLFGLLLAGNALIIFGPILNNPLGLSETAFYRFYDHANHANYPANLRHYGRRPIGFPRRADH
ncbi:MAG TPA: hypothetical protein VG838_11890 [Opitutaceae bacterium]|nr:hypothetical protein [Opitutaceae bacterium]